MSADPGFDTLVNDLIDARAAFLQAEKSRLQVAIDKLTSRVDCFQRDFLDACEQIVKLEARIIVLEGRLHDTKQARTALAHKALVQ